MATVKKGIHVKPPEWWKHMKWMKKFFWHKERQATRKDIQKQVGDLQK